ncbi:MAG: AbrB/MazE/SpoVT family DNA-binding domain-containing protein [Desulfobacteraceae bacterium]|nr:AbrB/MazE/SpoVT family DNA-binding domain-containing protein [Desulfobacteraceae bacterium]MBC2755747.1 AbrB/MazE/SpoVT family DNA-binding domain-containing protein [Desulfobacteraceae bacterium]
MPLVKVKDKFQVTIPASIRRDIDLDIGDFLEAEVCEDGILLIPKTVTDRKALLEKFRKAFFEANPDSPFDGKSEEELMRIATDAVKATRAAKRPKK